MKDWDELINEIMIEGKHDLTNELIDELIHE
jgi:hypothetical protein